MSLVGARNASREQALRIGAPIALGVLVLIAWQLLVDVAQVTPRMLPSPTAIVDALVTHSAIIIEDALITGGNALVGLVCGSILAIVAAGVAAWARPVDAMSAPVVAAIAVVPIVALTPLFNTMFGASSQFGRQAIAGIAAFVPVYLNTLRGLRQARPVQRDLFRAYAAGGGQTFRRLTLPTALPYLTVGVRIASSLAVISALVAEYFGGPADGIGTAIATMAKSGNAALAWAYVFAGIVIGLLFFLATVLLERVTTRRIPA
jgi:NitT/TauT family transport system permease protein